jgi:hypothetical protein
MKKALIYTGVALGSIAIGFVGYRIYSRWGKKIVKENNATIIIDETPPENVEEEGDFNYDSAISYIKSESEQEWTLQQYRDYFESGGYSNSEYYV